MLKMLIKFCCLLGRMKMLNLTYLRFSRLWHFKILDSRDNVMLSTVRTADILYCVASLYITLTSTILLVKFMDGSSG